LNRLISFAASGFASFLIFSDICCVCVLSSLSSVFSSNSSVKSFCSINIPAYSTTNNKLNLLIVGGSLGSKPINDIVSQLQLDINIWHQTGKQHLDTVRSKYSNKNAKITPFIDDMAQAYAWADVVLCRAGAMTVSELILSAKQSLISFAASGFASFLRFSDICCVCVLSSLSSVFSSNSSVKSFCSINIPALLSAKILAL
jgi:hypothetical protein